MNRLILKNFARHIHLDDQETDYVQSLLKYSVAKKNTVLLNIGDINRYIHFTEKGCLRMFSTDDNGREHIVSFYPEGWWAADLSSLYSRSGSLYTIDALEDSELLSLSRENLELLYEKIPKFERFFRIFFQNALIMYQRRMVAVISQSAEKRYAQFQKRYPGLEQRIAQKHIASYLGITPVFLSILRKRI